MSAVPARPVQVGSFRSYTDGTILAYVRSHDP